MNNPQSRQADVLTDEVVMSVIESLECRRLFYSISGQVWNDTDNSKTFDTSESVAAGVTVYLDNNYNSRRDTGETSVVTNANGLYTFSGLANGTYSINVVNPSGKLQSYPGVMGESSSKFNIELVFSSPLTAAQKNEFVTAAQRWETIILNDLPDVVVGNRTIDDILIEVTTSAIDGVDGTLAETSANDLRSGSFLPYTASMDFDTSDLATLQASDELFTVALHEMAHALGFGTIWTDKNLVTGSGTSNPRFTGAQAVAAYKSLFATNATSIPLETTGGVASAESHWAEDTFIEELMTPMIDAGAVPLSKVTVASMADLGYTVNLNTADVWDPSSGDSTIRATPIGNVANIRLVRISGASVGSQNFGLRGNTGPTIKAFSISPLTNVVVGDNITISAASLSDPENDSIASVSFYRESNGIVGLQTTGDTFIATRTTPKRGVYASQTSTANIPSGDNIYYARALDNLGAASVRQGTITLLGPPARPAARNKIILSATSIQLNWRDRSDNETAFRIQRSTSPTFANNIINYTVTASIQTLTVNNLTSGTTYYWSRALLQPIRLKRMDVFDGVVPLVIRPLVCLRVVY